MPLAYRNILNPGRMIAEWSELVKGTNSVTVNLGATFPAVTLYDPTLGTTATRTMQNAAVPLTLSDHPVIIEIPTRTWRSTG
jgi:hypothetical protein